MPRWVVVSGAGVGGGSFGGMSRPRLPSPPQVVAALKELEHEAFINGAIVRVQDIDYNLLSFEEQVKVDLQVRRCCFVRRHPRTVKGLCRV
jgi:hypothetical protein